MKKKLKKQLGIFVLVLVAALVLYKLFAPQCQMQCTEDATGNLACMPVCTQDPENQQGHGGLGLIDEKMHKPKLPSPTN